MAFSQAQLDAIEAGIASGSLSISYEGKSNTFRSLEDMLYIRRIIMVSLGLVGGSQTVLAAHDRGYPASISTGDDGEGIITGY